MAINQKNLCQTLGITSLGALGGAVLGMGLTPASGAALAAVYLIAEKIVDFAQSKIYIPPSIQNKSFKIIEIVAQGASLSVVLQMLHTPLPLFGAYVFTKACHLFGADLGDLLDQWATKAGDAAKQCCAYFKKS